MLRKVISGRLYNSITRHNRSLFDYSKDESESKGIYWIYGINLTATWVTCRVHAVKQLKRIDTEARLWSINKNQFILSKDCKITICILICEDIYIYNYIFIKFEIFGIILKMKIHSNSFTLSYSSHYILPYFSFILSYSSHYILPCSSFSVSYFSPYILSYSSFILSYFSPYILPYSSFIVSYFSPYILL